MQNLRLALLCVVKSENTMNLIIGVFLTLSLVFYSSGFGLELNVF